MSKAAGLVVTMILGAGGLLVSTRAHASRARPGTSIIEEVGAKSGLHADDSLTFYVFGFKFNRLWIPYWPCSERTVHDSTSSACALPENSTLHDLEVLNRAMACHDPLPPGFPTPSHERRTLARTTGAVDWMGRHEIQLHVTDGVGRIAAAKLYLDDELVSEATSDNGGSVDRGDESEATLTFFLPWIPRFTVTLITDDRDGKMEESSFSIGRSR
jgi:hypothetical protein